MRKLAFLFICLLLSSAQAQPWYGSGTPNDPYQIWDACDMQAIGADANYWEAHFKLMADIDLSIYSGDAFNLIGEHYYDFGWVENPFNGVFDGNGHTIKNFSWISTDTGSAGLFVYLGSDGQIKNLALEDANIDAAHAFSVGGLSGKNSGMISNCYVTGSVRGSQLVGGLVGSNNEGTILGCHAVDSVTGRPGPFFVGGLVGSNRYGTILDCYATGAVSGPSVVGGLAGENFDGAITNCYATGSVTGNGDNIGGLIGLNTGAISNCYATGSAQGEDTNGNHVGGLVGGNSGQISNCYATGTVRGGDLNGSDIGGLVGVNTDATISNCHATGSVTATGDRIGGLVGHNGDGTIWACSAAGSVLAGNYSDCVGGLVGSNYSISIISSCCASGDVSGGRMVGGLVGYSTGNNEISNCYASGGTSGTEKVGGLTGYARSYIGSTKIYNCYATGSIFGTADSIGGLVGENRLCFVLSSFWDVNTSGEPNSDGGTGLTTPEMQDANTYMDAGWDFNTPIWKFCSEPNYPSLWWEECPLLEPTELIAELLEEVAETELPRGIENSLMAKLNSALRALEDENENNDAAAVNILEAFINAVEAQRGKKIPEAEADDLIAAALKIIELLSAG